MNKQEVIEEFCKLSEKVMRQVYKSTIAADCFCGFNSHGVESFYQFDSRILKFIRQAVDRAIVERGK